MDSPLNLTSVSGAGASTAGLNRQSVPQARRQDDRPEPQAVPDVTVTLSPAAREAEKASSEVAVSDVRTPSPAGMHRAQPTVPSPSEAVAAGVSEPSRARPEPAPDAASVAHRPAVQLYLDNATRPDNQPPASPLRTSA